MELTLKGIADRERWEKAGIALPNYDVKKAAAAAKAAPRWLHFGIGNIFRIFIGGIADELLEKGALDRGVTCAECFDPEIVDRVWRPYDDLVLSVILKSDGTRDMKVLGFAGETVKACPDEPAEWARLKVIFTCPDLQMVTFTVTEKGYALRQADGAYFPFILEDLENGPDRARSVIAIVTAMLYERFRSGARPIALVSMDNCSRNGSLLRSSVLTVAEEWRIRGFVTDGFLTYVGDEERAAFPWTMIDKITPRPSEDIADDLEALGVSGMRPIVTAKRTYIAPFVNAEGPQYLVSEDRFPNGRPALEMGPGVYMTDGPTVDLAERMKVTACLNPVHSALGPIGVLLGVDLFADLLSDPALLKMGRTAAYDEGIPVIDDPGIISPKAFTDELFFDRFPNRYLGDTNLRLCTDVTQGFGVRFGRTIRAYKDRYGSAEGLTAIPLGIAGCMRYALGIDDRGGQYELAPDPLIGGIHDRLSDIVIGRPETFSDQLRPILSNANIFYTDLYEAGIGDKIERMFREMLAGPGAVRETVDRYFL